MHPAAFPEDAQARSNRVLGSVQHFADDRYVFVSREVQQNPIVVFGPWVLGAFLVALETLSDEPEMAGTLPDYVRPPVWVASQKFTYRFLLA